jgi:hypothetical protein
MKILTIISSVLLLGVFMAMGMIGFKPYMIIILIASSIVFILMYKKINSNKTMLIYLELISLLMLVAYFLLGKFGVESTNQIIRYILDSDMIFFVFIVFFPIYMISTIVIVGKILIASTSSSKKVV